MFPPPTQESVSLSARLLDTLDRVDAYYQQCSHMHSHRVWECLFCCMCRAVVQFYIIPSTKAIDRAILLGSLTKTLVRIVQKFFPLLL